MEKETFSKDKSKKSSNIKVVDSQAIKEAKKLKLKKAKKHTNKVDLN